MTNKRFEKLIGSKEAAEKQISKLTSKQKSALEKSWDVEHAYYSSTLEGSKLSQKEFEKLSSKVK